MQRRVANALLVAMLATACETVSPSPSGSPSAVPATPSPPRTTDPPPPPSSTPPAPAATPDFVLGEPTDPITGGMFGGPGSHYAYAAVAYGDGFVVGGVDLNPNDEPIRGAIWSSADGRAWARATASGRGFDEAEVDHMATDGELLVAMGIERFGPDDEAPFRVLTWRSREGLEWERLDESGGPLEGLRVDGLSGHRDGFVAWGVDRTDAAVVLSSSDGISWTLSYPAPRDGARIGDVARTRDGFVAVGWSRDDDLNTGTSPPARAWWSADGIAWRDARVENGYALGRAFPVGSGIFAIGSPRVWGPRSTYVRWHSTDGASWSIVDDARPGRRHGFASDGAAVIAWDWSESGAMEASTDGLEWHPLGKRDAGGFPSERFVIGRHGLLLVLYDPNNADTGVQFIPFR